MKEIDSRAVAFRQMAEVFLQSEPERLEVFCLNWNKQEFRAAYLIWNEFTREHTTTLSSEQVKVDEDFYWLYIA